MDEEQNSCTKRSYFHDDSVQYERKKRRNLVNQRELRDLMTELAVYRYLCPIRKAGTVIGRGGEIMKYLRRETGAKVLIEDAIHGCEERVVTIFSSNKETNPFQYKQDYVCPAQDALFRVHDRLIEAESLARNEDHDVSAMEVYARLLIPSDQARCIIGRRGHTIQIMRNDTGARILVWNDERVPICANSCEELLEICGDGFVVREALFQISCLLREHPSRSHDQILSNLSYGCNLVRDSTTSPCSLVNDNHEFTLRLVCPSANIRDVIGKGGNNINQIRQESGAAINLKCFFDEEDCMILISAKELMESSNSPTIKAVTQLQPSCSTKVEGDGDETLYITRLLVPRSQVGSLIGKGGLVIKEMRRTAQASISILEESLPSVASEDDAMVEISGHFLNVRGALIQVIDRLKAGHLARKGLFFASSQYVSRISTRESMHAGRSFETRSYGHSNSSEWRASVGRAPLEILAGSDDQQNDGDN